MPNQFPSSLPTHTEVLVIGGGIVGAGALRDLALHGIEATLIEAKTICSQTSSKSSKMLHGGIRYLETYDFDLVKEALEEKNLWLRLAPQYAREEMFTFPIYKNSPRPLWMLRAGLSLYDFLSHFQNSSHQILSAKEVLKRHPKLSSTGLVGAGLYADAVVDDLSLGLACVRDALTYPNIHVSEETELLDLFPKGAEWIASVKVKATNEVRQIIARDIIVALGPFTDQVLGTLKAIPWRPILLPSRGSHIWLRPEKLGESTPLVLQDKGNRIVFVIPHAEQTLIGTTELTAPDNFFDLEITPAEEDYLLNIVSDYYPQAGLVRSDIVGSFSGIRPLVREDHEASRGKTARYHKVFWPFSNMSIIVGGKYTTFRKMVQESVRQIVLKRARSYDNTRSARPLR